MRLEDQMSTALLSVLDACGIGVFLGDGRHLLDVNASMCRLFERSYDELLASEPTALLTPASRTIMARRRLHETYPVLVDEISLLLPGQGTRPVRVASQGMADGTRIGLVVDEGRLRSVEHELQLLHSLADHSPAGVLLWDGNGCTEGGDLRLRWASRPARALLGRAHEDVLGARLADLLPLVEPELSQRALGLCGTGLAENIGDAELQAPDGSLRIFNRTLIGLPEQLVAVRVEDVTEERAAERARLALLKRLVALGDTERSRLAAALHDGAVQEAAAAATLLEALVRHPTAPDSSARLQDASAILRELVTTLRRSIFQLSPTGAHSTDFPSAVRKATDVVLGESDIKVELDCRVPGTFELEADLRSHALRVLTEALTNVKRHAQAEHVRVGVALRDGALELDVCDDGVGMNDPHRGGHFGLHSMRERAIALGGRCTITPAPHGGTWVRAVLPLSSDAPPTAIAPGGAVLADLGSAEVAALQLQLGDTEQALSRALAEAATAKTRLRQMQVFDEELLTGTLELTALAPWAVSQIAGIVPDFAIVHRTVGDKGTLTLSTCAPEHQEHIKEVEELVVHAGHGRVAVDTGFPVIIKSAPHDATQEVASVLIAPLGAAGRAIGTLSIVRRGAAAPFDDTDIQLATHLALQLATALTRAAQPER